MSSLVPNTPTTPQQLSSSVFQMPAPPESTPSGGVTPGMSSGAPAASPGPTTAMPAPQQASNPYAAATPVASAQPVAQPQVTQAQPVATRAMLDSYVNLGLMTPDEAKYYRSDADLILEIDSARKEIEAARQQMQQQPPATPTPPPVQPQTPVAPQKSDEELMGVATSLLQTGALEMVNGRYTSKVPELQTYADKLNAQQWEMQKQMAELRNPSEWLKKHGSGFIEEVTKPLQDEIKSLKEQLSQTVPKPHEAWIAQNRDRLYVMENGQPTQQLSPAGQVYDRVYRTASSQGITDPVVLHQLASEAAGPLLTGTAPAAAAQPQPQSPSFWAQASQASATNPGFNLPGTKLSSHQQQQTAIPVTNTGYPDMMAMAQGVLNGSLPRV